MGSPDQAADLVDRAGRPLDLRQSFTLTDDRDDMAHFLRTTGYLIVRGVFATSEIDELNALIAAEKAKAWSGDNRSWWATGADGREVCCRLTYLGLRDQRFARLADDSRLRFGLVVSYRTQSHKKRKHDCDQPHH